MSVFLLPRGKSAPDTEPYHGKIRHVYTLSQENVRFHCTASPLHWELRSQDLANVLAGYTLSVSSVRM